jgi:excisionase family DNA binding protein
LNAERVTAGHALLHPSDPGPESEYLTAAQLAELLQVSTRTVARWASSDPSMPVTRLGGVVRFHRARVERWLRASEQGRPRARKQRLSLAKPASVQGAANA